MDPDVSLTPVNYDPWQPDFTPVDHDPFAEMQTYAKSLPTTLSQPSTSITPNDVPNPPQSPAMVHTIGQSGMPYSDVDMALDPSQSTFTRGLAAASVIGSAIPKAAVNAAWNIPVGIYQGLKTFGDVEKGEVPIRTIDPQTGVSSINPNVVAASTNLSGALATPALDASPVSPNALGIFAGQKAATANLPALEKAQLLESQGTDPRSILQGTGWFRGADSQWRFEIPDNKMQLTPQAKDVLNTLSTASPQATASGPAGAVFSHPDLFAAYPQLADLPTKLQLAPETSGKAAFKDLPMELNAPFEPTTSSDTFNSVGIHELQHSVQDIEGFARGTNPNFYQNYPEASNGLDPRTAYYNTAGEVEARNAQARWLLTPEERSFISPQSTEGIPRSDQIILTPVENNPFE